MTINLIAALEVLEIRHHILLVREWRSTCKQLQAKTVDIACVWSSYLLGLKSASGKAPKVAPIEKLWLQRFHYVGRAIGMGLNVLLLDSDVVLSRSPYPYLKGHLGRFNAVVLGDDTLSARPLHMNGGVWYIQNASRGGALRSLFRRFDEHVQQTIRHGSGELFDQSVLNGQAHAMRLEHDRTSFSSWLMRTVPAAMELYHLFPAMLWEWECCSQTPSELPTPGGSYPATYGLRMLTLGASAPSEGRALGAARASHSESGRAESTPASTLTAERPSSLETIVKAPTWLFSAEADLVPPPLWKLPVVGMAGGVRVDSRGWGAHPPPWVLAHFVCSAWPSADGREEAMRAFGYWRERAIGHVLPGYRARTRALRMAMIGLAAPQYAQSVDEASSWARLVIWLAMATGRTPVLPELSCSRSLLDERCVWLARTTTYGGANGHGGSEGHNNEASSAASSSPSSSPSSSSGLSHTCLLRWPSPCARTVLLPSEAAAAARTSVVRVPLAARSRDALARLLRMLNESHAGSAAKTPVARQGAKLVLLELPSGLAASEVKGWLPSKDTISHLHEHPASGTVPYEVRMCYRAFVDARCAAVC